MAETGLAVKDAEAKKCVSARFLELQTACIFKELFPKILCNIVNFFLLVTPGMYFFLLKNNLF